VVGVIGPWPTVVGPSTVPPPIPGPDPGLAHRVIHHLARGAQVGVVRPGHEQQFVRAYRADEVEQIRGGSVPLPLLEVKQARPPGGLGAQHQ